MISIAIATYNGEKYLQQQLKCIATQSVYKNFHGIQTDFDDLFRFISDFKGLKEQEL